MIEKKSRAWVGHYSIVTLFPNSQLEPDLQPDPESDNSFHSHDVYDNQFFLCTIYILHWQPLYKSIEEVFHRWGTKKIANKITKPFLQGADSKSDTPIQSVRIEIGHFRERVL